MKTRIRDLREDHNLTQMQLSRNNPLSYNPNIQSPLSNFSNQNALNDFKNQGITYEDLAALLYGNR